MVDNIEQCRAMGPGFTPFQSISYPVYFHPRRFNSAFHPGTETGAAVLDGGGHQ